MQISYSDSSQFLQLSHGANTHHLKHKDTGTPTEFSLGFLTITFFFYYYFTFRILAAPYGVVK